MLASTSSSSARSRTRRQRSSLAARAALGLAALATVTSAAQFEPPNDQVLLGFWFDSAMRELGFYVIQGACRALGRATRSCEASGAPEGQVTDTEMGGTTARVAGCSPKGLGRSWWCISGSRGRGVRRVVAPHRLPLDPAPGVSLAPRPRVEQPSSPVRTPRS